MDEGLIRNLDEAWNVSYDDLVFEKEIGKGGFGSVFQGEYLGTPVAIKRLVFELCTIDQSGGGADIRNLTS